MGQRALFQLWYPFHQSYSICPSPLPAFNATGKSPRGGEKILREKMCSHTLNKGSVLLVPPMTFIFCQTNLAKKMNASGDALSPCSSELLPLLCTLWRGATVKEQSGEYVGALPDVRLPFFSCEKIGLNSPKEQPREHNVRVKCRAIVSGCPQSLMQFLCLSFHLAWLLCFFIQLLSSSFMMKFQHFFLQEAFSTDQSGLDTSPPGPHSSARHNSMIGFMCSVIIDLSANTRTRPPGDKNRIISFWMLSLQPSIQPLVDLPWMFIELLINEWLMEWHWIPNPNYAWKPESVALSLLYLKMYFAFGKRKTITVPSTGKYINIIQNLELKVSST